ncbi:GNAT family N-acetyltransferase [uncultured Methylobacterium sp.]|jgi:GNAT superfamily N-acetyltransferase|uniref:GNAT family N-acetyltransferase n=1 Tax=uncultured Methylobacterium sp. TaxID=157278 RepID=UPI0026340A85|nr:GNAT family N-acetyltransferase [uncultured Methylobacterium sp.]
MPPIRTLVLDSFLLRTVDLAEVDPRVLHALSVGVRWPHRVPDWRTLLAAGRGIAAVDEIGRAVGSAMWFPYSDGFATIGMVITSPRLQAHGAGRWLMDQILAAAGPRAFGLNATREAHRLYQSLGFVDEATLYQRQGRALPPEDAPLPPGATLRAAQPADLDALVRLDARAFGAPRPALLAHLLAAGAGTVLARDGRIEAYALSRPFGRGQVVGPLVAACDGDAIAVGRPHVAAQAGRFLRLDTRRADGPFAAFLARSGLAVFDTLTTMSLGRSWPAPEPDGPVTYALASQALS